MMMDSNQLPPVTSSNFVSSASPSSSAFRSLVGQQSPISSCSKPQLVSAESITSITAHRRKRLVRSENVTSGSSGCLGSGRSGSRHYSHHYRAWESIFRESLLHMAWPISLSMSTDGSADPSIVVDFLPLKISSSSSDLVSRRGAFSRRHYGSVELLPQTETESGGDLIKCRRFRLENGEGVGDRDEVYNSPNTPVLENPEYQTRWYFKYFLGKLHQIYVGTDHEKQPFFLSVVLTDTNNQGAPQYKAILWKKTGAQKIYLPHTPGRPLTVKQILSNFQNMDRLEKSPKEVVSPELQKSLLLLEE